MPKAIIPTPATYNCCNLQTHLLLPPIESVVQFYCVAQVLENISGSQSNWTWGSLKSFEKSNEQNYTLH